MSTMTAVVLDGYGGPERFEVREVQRPEAGYGQLLVRIRATGVNPIDWKLASGSLRLVRRIRFPFIPGGDVAGEIVEVGDGVEGFERGDRVFALVGADRGGSYAGYIVIGESEAVKMPADATFEEAAAIPLAGLTALQAIRDKGRFEPGGRMLITGASGGVGSFAVQIGKALSATVTGVASGRNRSLVEGLGADEFIDYTRDGTDRASGPFDLIFDAAAASSFWACRPALAPRGVYVTTVPGAGHFATSLATTVLGIIGYRKRARTILVRPNATDLRYLAGLYDTGELRPVVSVTLPLKEATRAHELSRTGHAGGKIVLLVESQAVGKDPIDSSVGPRNGLESERG